MRNHLNRSTIVALAFAIGAAGFTVNNVANAGDACAGQSWPNQSPECIEQMAKQLGDTMTVKEKPKSRAPAAKFKTN